MFVGKRVYVGGCRWVTGVVTEEKTEPNGTTVLALDWGVYGSSKVKLHDKGGVWWFAEEPS